MSPVIRHIALFRLAPDLSPQRRSAFVEAARRLAEYIPSVASLEAGPNLALQPGGFDFALLLDFADEEAFHAYKVHSAHVRFIDDHVRPCVTETARTQIRLTAVSSTGVSVPGG
jgi:hypothetical protein